jgi:hypothetical protein
MFNLKNNKILIVIIIIVILSLFYLLITSHNANKFEKIITLKKKYINDSVIYYMGKNKHYKFRIIDSDNKEYKFNKYIGGMFLKYYGVKKIYESLKVGKKYKISGNYSKIRKIEEVDSNNNSKNKNNSNNKNQ